MTDRIVAAIEAGADECKMPWHADAGGALALPINAETGKAYRGVNPLVLWAVAQEAGYTSGIWATYRQWAALGAQVRKGEKAAPVVFWKMLDADEAEEQPA